MNQIPPPFLSPPSKDAEHLKLLAIFHFVFAGLAVLGIAFLYLHYAIMSTVMNDPKFWRVQKARGFSPQEFITVFRLCYLFPGILFLGGGLINVLSGSFLRARTNRMFSLIVAGLDCLQIPLGTVLGVFTIIVLMRDSVRALYDSPPV